MVVNNVLDVVVVAVNNVVFEDLHWDFSCDVLLETSHAFFEEMHHVVLEMATVFAHVLETTPILI